MPLTGWNGVIFSTPYRNLVLAISLFPGWDSYILYPQHPLEPITSSQNIFFSTAPPGKAVLWAASCSLLAVALRSHRRIRGVLRYGVEHTVSLYADDLLVYISDPSTSIPTILDTFTSFGHVSGYKLNLSKSEILPLNPAARSFLLHNFPFKVASDSCVYLGILVTAQFEDLFKANILPSVAKMQDDSERWNLLNLSLAARINSIKMNTLPKFSYLFQCPPIFLPQSFFPRLIN